MKRSIIQSLAVALLLLFVAAGHVQAQDLVFTIKTDKASYKKGDPVTCTLMLKNTGKTNLVVNNRFLVNVPAGPHDVSFQVTDPDMNTVPFTSKIKAAFESTDYIVLAPGKTVSLDYLLSKRYDLVKKGTYKLTAWYENKQNAPAALNMQPAWKGTLNANSTVLTIR